MVESTYVMVHIITCVRIQSVTARRQHLATLHVRCETVPIMVYMHVLIIATVTISTI